MAVPETAVEEFNTVPEGLEPNRNNACVCAEENLHQVPGCGSASPRLHRDVLGDFLALRDAAAADGIALFVASAYRNIERQLLIWNEKAEGKRPVYDVNGQPIDLALLEPLERIEAILKWTALPGASRHHWGSDIDVYDGGIKLEQGADVLLPERFSEGGEYASLAAWLAAHLHEYGFYRPYMGALAGVQAEPWHISHRAVSVLYRSRIGADELRTLVESLDLRLRDTVLSHFDRLFHCYFEPGLAD